MTNKKQSITIANYQQLAMKTCLKSARNMKYATFNLRAELAELVGKIEGGRAKQIRDGKDFDAEKNRMAIRDEIGDCYWQLALLCQLKKLPFDSFFKQAKSGDVDEIKVSSVVDWNRSTNDYDFFAITAFFNYLKSICAVYCLKPSDCLRANIRKLASRQKRGVIKGNGDSR